MKYCVITGFDSFMTVDGKRYTCIYITHITSHRKILQSLEGQRFSQSLWNSARIMAGELWSCLSNFKGIYEHFNSLAPGRFECNFRKVIFKLIIVTDSWGNTCEIALRWMSLDLIDDKSTLAQVMACCLMQQAITLANVDPNSCRHMASLDHYVVTCNGVVYIKVGQRLLEILH